MNWLPRSMTKKIVAQMMEPGSVITYINSGIISSSKEHSAIDCHFIVELFVLHIIVHMLFCVCQLIMYVCTGCSLDIVFFLKIS